MSMYEVVEFAQHLEQEYLDQGFSEQQARELGETASKLLLSLFAGMQLYIPQDQSTHIHIRDVEIRRKYREFVVETCRMHNITLQTFHKIIKGRPTNKPPPETQKALLLPNK